MTRVDSGVADVRERRDNASMQAVKRIVLGGALTALFMLPIAASAQTMADLQAQVNALIQRLGTLQSVLNNLPPAGTNPPPTVTTTPTPVTTPTSTTPPPISTGSVLAGGLLLNRDIDRGDSGADVTRLQQFLARDATMHPSGLATGFYGPLTEAAVQRFQVACGLVSTGDYGSTGYGRVGPRTRNALQNGCGQAPTMGVVGGQLRVAPNQGNAPLTVTVTADVNTSNSCDYGSYTLDFGDGTAPVSLLVPAGRCSQLEQQIPHTYSTNGTFTVSLRVGTHYSTVTVMVGGTGVINNGGVYTSGFAMCMASGGVISNTVPRSCSLGGVNYFESSTNTHTTTTGSADYVQANPTSGAAPFNTTFTVRINSSSSCNGGQYTLDFGDGVLATLTYQANACAPVMTTIAHSYTTAGTYTTKLFAVPASSVNLATPVANVAVTANAPVASTVDPQLTIQTAYQGDFHQVRATFQLADACTPFTLYWGDGSTPVTRAAGSGCAASIDHQTLTHTYPSTTNSTTYNLSLTYGLTGYQSTRSASVVIIGGN